MRKLIVILVLLINALIIFYGCKKSKEETEFDTQTSQDNALAESTFNDVNNISIQALEQNILSTYKIANPANTTLNSCTHITKTPDSTGTGGTIVIDFGPVNCRCQGIICTDTRYRRGKINITYTGPYRSPGTVIQTSFDNYFVGYDTTKMFQVTGTKTVTNLGYNAANHLNFNIQVDGHLINSTGGTMHWNSQRNREWIAGENTLLNWTDDEYIITGSASGTNFEGNTFTVIITSGLHVALNCPYVKQGVFELTPGGKPTRTLDYGDGTCDAKATVTVNGTTFPITLR
jgi:hypothetical protein